MFSNKGGAGVSTIATNLSISLKRLTGREVALADLDVHSGDAAFMLGLAPTRSLGDVLAAPKIDSASVHDALIKHDSGVFILSSPSCSTRWTMSRPRRSAACSRSCRRPSTWWWSTAPTSSTT